MKTLDDALSVAAGIEPDTYEIDGDFVYLASTEPGVLVDGIVTTKTLRRIADHLDPPATEEPRGCPLPGACSCSTAALHIDRIKAEARREALEEAERSIPDGWDVGNGSSTRVIEPGEARAAIRALIEKEPKV